MSEGEMTERVLTDGELINAYNYVTGEPWSNPHLLGLRAVEAAVLAKLPSPRWGGLTIQKGISEREARQRERAAWDARDNLGRTLWQGRDYITRDQAWGNAAVFTGERDRLYPLPSCDKCGQKLP